MPYDYQWPPTGVTYTPVLQGGTDNPTVTYTTQYGKYWLNPNKRCEFEIEIVASTMTKTTLTDAVRVSLPFAAKSTGPLKNIMVAQLENADVTSANTANHAFVDPNSSYLTFVQVGLATKLVNFTYTLMGVLTGTVTIRAKGVYEIA